MVNIAVRRTSGGVGMASDLVRTYPAISLDNETVLNPTCFRHPSQSVSAGDRLSIVR